MYSESNRPIQGQQNIRVYSTATSAAQLTAAVSTLSSAPDDASIRKTSTVSASWLATNNSSPFGDKVKLRAFEPLSHPHANQVSVSQHNTILATAKVSRRQCGWGSLRQQVETSHSILVQATIFLHGEDRDRMVNTADGI